MQNRPYAYNSYNNFQIVSVVGTLIFNGLLSAAIDHNNFAKGIVFLATTLLAGPFMRSMFKATAEERNSLSQSTLFTIAKNTIIIQSANVIREVADAYFSSN